MSSLWCCGVRVTVTDHGEITVDFLPNFSPMMLLHGEQYLEIKGPIPTEGTLVTEAQVSEVLDKGKAAAVTTFTTTTNKATGEIVFQNQSTVFIRGSGGFGGKKTGVGESHFYRRIEDRVLMMMHVTDRGAATATNKPPARAPDAVVEQKTLPIQAALYRLGGTDLNPLHVSISFRVRNARLTR